MSTATLTLPIAAAPSASASTRPGLGRLTRVELRKMLDTRAGFWLQVATVGLTVVAVIIRLAVGNPQDHTFRSVLNVGLAPASVLLAVVGILLVTSEWSQRTGLITFTLVPVRSRVLAAKLLASLVLALAAVVVCLAIVVVGVLLAAPGADGTWSGAAAMAGQSAVYVTASIVTGVAFGAILLASAPAIVANFALPTAWAALATIPVFASVAPWMDPSFDGMSGNVLSTTQWAHAGTSIALWTILPLLLGAWRITRREITA
jgi:ABC-2 type transport system permease protein